MSTLQERKSLHKTVLPHSAASRQLKWLALTLAGILSAGAVSVQAAPVFGPSPGAATTKSITVNGYSRNFVYAISGYPAPAAGRPLVIHLHGDGGNMGLSAAWQNAVLNDDNGAVLLSAQGRNNIPAAAAIEGH